MGKGAVSPPQRRWASTARGCKMRTSQRRPAGVSMGCGPSTAKGSELRPASRASMRVTAGSAGGAFGFRGGVSGTAAFYRILAAGPTGSAENVAYLGQQPAVFRSEWAGKLQRRLRDSAPESLPQPPPPMTSCVATKSVPSGESNVRRVALCARARNTPEA